ncbi:MAG: hypothetical protein IPP44_17310 [Ideonella sp.]|jgi:hypothetical protein|nr:hypothetical protein [Ideonella sp.]
MNPTLPAYVPPNAQRANLAVAAAPIVVLLAFTLLVARMIEADTAFALFAAATVWVVHEMHDYQKTIDAYNAEYASRHLAWRSSDTLQSLANAEGTDPATREFVQRYVVAGRQVMLDGMAL